MLICSVETVTYFEFSNQEQTLTLIFPRLALQTVIRLHTMDLNRTKKRRSRHARWHVTRRRVRRVSAATQHRQCINMTMNFLSPNDFRGGIAISITYSESVSIALIIQHATRMRHTISSSVACPELSYFYTLSHKWQDFRKKKIEYKMCFFSTNVACKIYNSKQLSGMLTQMYVGLCIKYPLFLWGF